MKTALTLPKNRFDESLLRLRTNIIEGTAQPGTLLAEAAVARQLGVSRVPVREALFALEREGLVEFSATGRAYVKHLTPKDFEELYILRLTLEPVAARLASTRFEGVIEALEANVAATERARVLSDVTRLDLEFHELILTASGHERLLKLWRSLRSELELWLGRLHRSHESQTKITRDLTVESHRGLIECFRTQSPAACERLMRQHVQGWREWLPMPEAGSNIL
jgi:DNA-binding GntR family transcriptional regulator